VQASCMADIPSWTLALVASSAVKGLHSSYSEHSTSLMTNEWLLNLGFVFWTTI